MATSWPATMQPKLAWKLSLALHAAQVFPLPRPSWPATMQPPLGMGLEAQALDLWVRQVTSSALPLVAPRQGSTVEPERSYRSFYPLQERPDDGGSWASWRVFGVGWSHASSSLPIFGSINPSEFRGGLPMNENRARISAWREQMRATREEALREMEAFWNRTPAPRPRSPPRRPSPSKARRPAP